MLWNYRIRICSAWGTVINASQNNRHISYAFNLHPKCIKDYQHALHDLSNINLNIDKNEVYEYYFMKNIYNTENWLFSDHQAMLKQIGGNAKQVTPKVYDVWLMDWTLERHNKLISNLRCFVDSNDYRLGFKHLEKSFELNKEM